MNKNRFIPPSDPVLPTLEKAVDLVRVRPFILDALKEIKKDSELRITEISLEYFHYKPGSSCRIVYRIFHPDQNETIAWGKVLPHTERKDINSGEKSYYIPFCHMKLYVLPHDNNLPGLKNIMNIRWLVSFLDLLYPGMNVTENRLKSKNIKLTVISYRPGNRCLIRVEGKIRGPEGKTRFISYIKVYPDKFDQNYIKTLTDLTEKFQDQNLFFPKLIGTSKKNYAVFFESIKGGSLFAGLKPENEKKIARRLSLALREIHKTHIKISSDSELSLELEELANCAVSLEKISDELYLPARLLYEKLAFDYFILPSLTYGTVHGDFSHEQVLVRKKYVYILDFDRLSTGDIYSDLGNFIANSIDVVLSDNLGMHPVAKFTQKFLKEYFLLADEPLDTFKIRWFTAACLLKLAIRPLRRAEPDWQQRSRSIIINGLKMLEGGWDDFFLPKGININTTPPSESNVIIQELKKSDPLNALGNAKPQSDFILRKAWPYKCSWLLLFESPKAKKGKEFQYIKVSESKKINRCSLRDERVLNHLSYCLDRAGMQEIFKSEAPDLWDLSGDMSVKDIRIKSYKPEHRCLIEYRIRKKTVSEENTIIYGKVCRTLKDAEFLFNTTRFFYNVLPENQLALFSFITEPLLVRKLNAVFFAHIPGREFFLLLKEKVSRNALEKIGLGLKTFHESGFQCKKRHIWEDEMKVLERWIKPVTNTFPIVKQDLNSLFDYLKDRGSTIEAGNLVPVHRDFYDKQILVNGNTIAFLDFDNVSMGDPAIDIGNFLAHLYLRMVQIGEDTACFNQFGTIFLKAYAPPSEKEFSSRITLYTVTSLLRLACVYLVRPRGCLLFYPLLRKVKQLTQEIN